MSRSVLSIVALLVLALVISACETAASPTPGAPDDPGSTPAGETTEPTDEPAPTDGLLARVQDRGELICGVNDGIPGFGFLDESGQWSGFDVDFCRAVAAAVLGDADAVEYRPLSADDRGPALQTGEIDVLIRNTTWTVTRDTRWGLFAPTTFYDGQGVMARSDVGASVFEDLDGATVCVQSGTTTELNLTDQARARNVSIEPQVYGDIDQTYQAYEEGRCDAVTSDISQLVARRTTFADADEHVILETVLSKEPLGPVAPLGDDQWFNVIKWVVFATIEAEELGITSENAEEMRETSDDPPTRRLLGVEPPDHLLGLEADWALNVITQVGNYAEIYDRNLGPDTPFNLERGLNSLWTDDGLLYAAPYR